MKYLGPKSVIFLILCLIFVNNSTHITQLISGSSFNKIKQEKILIPSKIQDQKIIQNTAIVILSDYDFESNFFSGSGTENDPFILEGLSFVGSQSFISITGTSSYFLIRNNSFLSTGDTTVAISLNSVENGIISNNDIENYKTGINVLDSEMNIISNNRLFHDSLKIDEGQTGILLTNSQFNIINNNTFLRYPFSAIYDIGDNNYIEYNTFVDNKHGIIISGNYNQIKGNLISNSTFGITLDHKFKFITNNSIISNIIENSNFPYTSEWGIKLYPKANNTMIKTNNFVGIPSYYAFDDGLDNLFESNYWEDWLGIGIYPIEGLAGNSDLNPLSSPNSISINEVDTKAIFALNTENNENSNFIIEESYLQLLGLTILVFLTLILGILYIRRSNKNPSFSKFIQLSEEGFLKNVYNKLIVGLENTKSYLISPEIQNAQVPTFETDSLVNYFPEEIRKELISSIKGRSVLVLIEIAYNNPETTNPAYLSKVLNIPPSTLTFEIKKLQKMNYIESFISRRVLEDPRYKNYVISEKGYRFLTLLKETIKITLEQNRSEIFT